MSFQHLEIERDGPIAIIWLNRPEKLNAMSADMWEDIPKAVGLLEGDDDIRVMIVAGRGTAFSVGIDIEMLAAMQPGDASQAEVSRSLYETIRRLQETNTCLADSPKPVIAAIHGFCLGEGINLVTACDLRLASADAVLSVRETRMGLVADVGVLQRLPSIVGAGHAAELAFTGRDITAGEAREIGLINQVFTDVDTLREGTRKVALEIASNSPLVVSGIKNVLAANRGRTVDQALEYVARWNSAHLLSNDLTEAVTAFFEKRKPEFTGT